MTAGGWQPELFKIVLKGRDVRVGGGENAARKGIPIAAGAGAERIFSIVGGPCVDANLLGMIVASQIISRPDVRIPR